MPEATHKLWAFNPDTDEIKGSDVEFGTDLPNCTGDWHYFFRVRCQCQKHHMLKERMRIAKEQADG